MAAKILVIDDDPETIRLLSLVLQRQGYDVLTALHGLDGIRLAIDNVPDLVIIDVMMPDIDGYQVTQTLRKNPVTTGCLLLLFSARSQMEDKVAGFQAGADDYLTKPIHPSELIKRIQALLSSSQKRGKLAPSKGYNIGIVSPKGGLGATSLALNLGISLFQKSKKEIIAAELRPGQGTWQQELNLTGGGNINQLLEMAPYDISPDQVEKELVRISYGIRLLLSTANPQHARYAAAAEQMNFVVQNLSTIASILLLDIGASFLTSPEKILANCHEILLITEPFPNTVKRTRSLLDELAKIGISHNKLITPIIINRVRADVQLTKVQVSDMLGLEIKEIIPPAPELAFQAALKYMPLVMIQPESLVTRQYNHLAGEILSRLPAA